jgi:hypothetical protein
MRQMAIAFVRLEAATSFPPAVGLAMSACESAWWVKLTGDWNYWGMTRAPETGPAKLCPTHEDVTLAEYALFRADERATETGRQALANGKWRIYLSRWFASYASLAESLRAFESLITDSTHRYASAWQQYIQDRDADALLSHVCDLGYATGPAKGVELTILHQQNIQHAVAAARAELATGTA